MPRSYYTAVPYEFSTQRTAIRTWRQLAQKIQLGFVVYKLAGGDAGFSRAHDRYVKLALGRSLDAMLAEVQRHVDLGLKTISNILPQKEQKEYCIKPAPLVRIFFVPLPG